MPALYLNILILVLILIGLVIVANKARLAYPIVLVAGGLLVSRIPALGHVHISPDVVFFVFLPPLLYEAAWQVSWKEFWRWRSVIISFAFPIVILTACAIAYFSVWLIPGFTLALGFLLGGIISPPDAISATAIMRQVKAPRTLVSVAEGESLLNDASSLIVVRFAVAAVLTGVFDLREASLSFAIVVVMGLVIGVAVGFVFYAIHRWLPVTPALEILLTFVTPYCMYYAAERFHFSGVLAVVGGGLFLSSRRLTLLSYQSRIQGVSVWNSVVFVLNSLIFLLMGLQLPAITAQLGAVEPMEAIGYGLAISLALVVIRLACTFLASGITMVMGRFITVADPYPGWKMPLLFGWSGIRGVVSLAAALSIPFVASDGQPFPQRNLILFITFMVILVTTLGQGLTLPWLIRKVDAKDRYPTPPEHEQDRLLRLKLAQATLSYLESRYSREVAANAALGNYRDSLRIESAALVPGDEGTRGQSHLDGFRDIYLDILQQQRKMIDNLNRSEDFDEEVIRKHQGYIDLEEFKARDRAPTRLSSH